MFDQYFIAGCLFWGAVLFCLYQICFSNKLHGPNYEATQAVDRRLAALCAALVILTCTVPMQLTPFQDPANNSYSRQYEYMAEAILNGRLYLDYGDMDERLLEMDNPYDPAARREAGINFHWDHAFYNGHYYMYFGVVPVFLLFLPVRLITGMSLDTLWATRIFAAVFICGVFALFQLLSQKFCKMTKGMYLLLSAAFSMMSIWYSMDAPMLYCTAIVSALCVEIWSLFFFVKAVWVEEEEKKRIGYAFCGSLCGALAFGCRPPIALANLLVLPMLAVYLKGKKPNWQLFRQLLFAASPYAVVAVLLMAYNYARFGSPFEFGQPYQLTLADQSGYTDMWAQLDPIKIWNGLAENFISYSPLDEEFPYISCGGAFVNFPILLVSLVGLSRKEIRDKIKKRHLTGFTVVLLVLPAVITAADVVWAPFLMERYRMDIYWLMGILCFLIIGLYAADLSNADKRKFSYWMSLWAFVTFCSCMWLFLVPYDGNFAMLTPAKLEAVRRVLTFGQNF